MTWSLSSRLAAVIPRFQLAFATGLATFACAGPAHAQATADPFAKVPPLSTACYAEKDPFVVKLDAAIDSVQKERERQKAVNAKIEQDYRNLDPMAMSQRMQEWMMSNPQEAMKYMQAVQATGESTHTELPEMQAAVARFDQEKADLLKRYAATLEQAYAPTRSRLDALRQKVATSPDCSTSHEGCTVPWVIAEDESIARAADSAYAAHCAEWYGTGGPIHDYLKRYRDWLVGTYLPHWAQTDDLTRTQYAIMDAPGAAWKSTLPHEEAIKYMRVVHALYGPRRATPVCTAEGCEPAW